ncbi:uncharacterized protein METZ01_LOCUS362306, partial [marine metagenome]
SSTLITLLTAFAPWKSCGKGLLVWPGQQVGILEVTFTSIACFPGWA